MHVEIAIKPKEHWQKKTQFAVARLGHGAGYTVLEIEEGDDIDEIKSYIGNAPGDWDVTWKDDEEDDDKSYTFEQMEAMFDEITSEISDTETTEDGS